MLVYSAWLCSSYPLALKNSRLELGNRSIAALDRTPSFGGMSREFQRRAEIIVNKAGSRKNRFNKGVSAHLLGHLGIILEERNGG